MQSLEVCGGDVKLLMPLRGLITASKYKENIIFTHFISVNKSTKRDGGKNTYQRHIDCKSLCHSSRVSSVEMNYRAEAFARNNEPFCDVRGLHGLIASVTSILKFRDSR